MSTLKRTRIAAQPVVVRHHVETDEASETETLDASQNGSDQDCSTELHDSGSGSDDSESRSVHEDKKRLESSFTDFADRYRIIKRIGEGTFSTVYKAEVLHYDEYDAYDDDDDMHDSGPTRSPTRFVAVKKIYVTSSPVRIYNELELLYDLRTSPNVCPLLTAFRHHDQVVAILPYYRHQDFRDYFRTLTVDDMRPYFQSLFIALKAVHARKIIHRDIKPTNFLYSPEHRRGVLVDFGLAEREGTDWHACACKMSTEQRKHHIRTSIFSSVRSQYHDRGQPMPAPAVPKEDSRYPRRANRAGTRGFRAPEVLLKCTMQSCQIDVWSCGIILLTFLSRRFPFFHSADDIDAFIELSTIFGRKKVTDAALLHGQALQTNIPTITDAGHGWEKIIFWSTGRDKVEHPFSPAELEAIDLLKVCLRLDPTTRITARNALHHPFIAQA